AKSTSYRQICDLATIQKWLQDGDRPDVPINPDGNPKTHNDEIQDRIVRLQEVIDFMLDHPSFGLAIVTKFDHLIYGQGLSRGKPKHVAWCTLPENNVILEINRDDDEAVLELRIVIADIALTHAFNEWFDTIWNSIPVDEKDRSKILATLRG